jgi:hypothetical protein
MLFTDRTYFTYDPNLGALGDTTVALKMADEYVRQFSAKPTPIFFEVDRSVGVTLDPMWSTPKSPRTQFSRQLNIPAINSFNSQKFRLWWNKVTTRGDTFWISNLGLQAANYFPVQGDQVYWTGYRLTIIEVSVPPEAYWGQTGVWTSLTVTCVLAPYGDAIPPANLAVINPGEQGGGRNTGAHKPTLTAGFTPVLPQPMPSTFNDQGPFTAP